MSSARPGPEGARPTADTSGAQSCTFCGHATVSDRGDMTLWIDGDLVVIENVPARVCRGCGETFYEDGITARVERLQAGRSDRPEPVRTIEAEVFAWSEL